MQQQQSFDSQHPEVVEVVDMRDNAATMRGLKAWGWLSYGLHLFIAIAAVLPSAQPSVALLLLALVLDLVKRSDAQGTWQQSHFSWRLRSVIWAGIWYVVTSPLWMVFIVPGWIAWTLVSLWFFYRIVRGMMAMNQERALPM